MNRRTAALVATLPLIGLAIQGGRYFSTRFQNQKALHQEDVSHQEANWTSPKYDSALVKSAGIEARRFILSKESKESRATYKADTQLRPNLQVIQIWPPQPGDYSPPYQDQADVWRVIGTIAYPKKGQPNTSLVLSWETNQRWDAIHRKWDTTQFGSFGLIKE